MYPVVHFEIPYENADRIIQFYTRVFGWDLKKLGQDMGNYVLATTVNKDAKTNTFRGAINGGFYPKKPDWPGQYPSVVIAVDDINAVMKKINEAGGEVLGEPMEIPEVGSYVAFYDIERNRLSILQPSTK